MSDWRRVFIVAPMGERTPTVLKGNQLPAPILFHLGNHALSIELGDALSGADALVYDALHQATKASPTFGWYPDISAGEEP